MKISPVSMSVIAVAVGMLVVGAAWFAAGNRTTADTAAPSPMRERAAHTYGETRAPITIVEWSDAECPFCARLHPTLKRIVDESDGGVRWQYRHLPLPNHRMAEPAAVAAECVGMHEGEEAFWSFLDVVFAEQSRLTDAFLAEAVARAGVSESQYAACREDVNIRDLIARDVAAAQHFGGSGTPFSLVIFSDRTIRPVRGALPYEQWMELLTPAPEA